MARSRNKSVILNYADLIEGSQIQLLELSGTGAGTDADSGGQTDQVAVWSDFDTVSGSTALSFNSVSRTLYSDDVLILSSSVSSVVAVSSSLNFVATGGAINMIGGGLWNTAGLFLIDEDTFAMGATSSTSRYYTAKLRTAILQYSMGVGDLAGRQFVFTSGSYLSNDHGHATEEGIVVYIHSGENPTTSPDNFLKLRYSISNTQSEITSGAGHLVLSSSVGSQITVSGTLEITAEGRLGIGTSAPENALHIQSLTAIQIEDNHTDNTAKGSRIGHTHYDIDEEPFNLINGFTANNINRVMHGGGTGLHNASTEQRFFTAENSTTTTGTEQMRINPSGSIDLFNQPRLSLTIADTSTASSDLYDVFDEDNFGGSISTIDNITETQIIYTETDGRFTVNSAGTYMINCSLFMLSSATTNIVNISVDVNGSSVYSASPLAHSGVDPVERTVMLMKTLSADDYINVTIDGTATTTIMSGTSMNIHKIA